MADTVLGAATGWAGLCLAWVDRNLNLPGWGGLSAAQAFNAFGGSAQATSTPAAGDIVLYGGNAGSDAGHAGIYAGGGQVISVLTDAKVHLTDIGTLDTYQGNTTPVFVKASSLGPNVQEAAQKTIDEWKQQIKDASPGPGAPGAANPPGLGLPPTKPGLDGALRCPDPTASPTIGPGGSIPNPAYYAQVVQHYFCVLAVDAQRLGFVLLGIVIVVLGLWLYAQDNDAPGSNQIKKIDKVPAQAAKIGAAVAG